MLTFNLRHICRVRGIDNPNAFLVKAGFQSTAAQNLLNNDTGSFKLRYIDKLCTILNCTPNELLIWTPNPGEKLEDTHPIQKLKKQNTDLNWQDTIKTIPLDQLSQIVQIINNHKNSH
ncbi:MAG: helix-turn-helix transcriptional regulator [Bacteroidota bacterium]